MFDTKIRSDIRGSNIRVSFLAFGDCREGQIPRYSAAGYLTCFMERYCNMGVGCLIIKFS